MAASGAAVVGAGTWIEPGSVGLGRVTGDFGVPAVLGRAAGDGDRGPRKAEALAGRWATLRLERSADASAMSTVTQGGNLSSVWFAAAVDAEGGRLSAAVSRFGESPPGNKMFLLIPAFLDVPLRKTLPPESAAETGASLGGVRGMAASD